MLPNSAIQVLEQSPSRLVVIDPPYYSLGIGFLIVAVITLSVTAIHRSMTGRPLSTAWLGMILTALPLLIGLGLMTSRSIITLDRPTDTLTFDGRWIGLYHERATYPLSSILNATVETSSASARLVIVFQSGDALALSSFTGRRGQYTGANAINSFLKQK